MTVSKVASIYTSLELNRCLETMGNFSVRRCPCLFSGVSVRGNHLLSRVFIVDLLVGREGGAHAE
jgi:hypothetical protein